MSEIREAFTPVQHYTGWVPETEQVELVRLSAGLEVLNRLAVGDFAPLYRQIGLNDLPHLGLYLVEVPG